LATAVMLGSVYKIETVAAADRQSARGNADSDEKLARELLFRWGQKPEAKGYFLSAAENWRIAGDLQKEKRARAQAENIEWELNGSWHFDEIVPLGGKPSPASPDRP
jgi:hypothetical protein